MRNHDQNGRIQSALIFTANAFIAKILLIGSHVFYLTEERELIEELMRENVVHSEAILEKNERNLIKSLIAAEDHRFFKHSGIDVVGIFRAAFQTAFRGKIQGGSTITQQLVRVITNDRRHSFSRKFKELCLSCALERRLSKQSIALAYLRHAYFGWHMSGIDQAIRISGYQKPLSLGEAAELISLLRYPRPKTPTKKQASAEHNRKNYILEYLKHHEH